MVLGARNFGTRTFGDGTSDAGINILSGIVWNASATHVIDGESSLSLLAIWDASATHTIAGDTTVVIGFVFNARTSHTLSGEFAVAIPPVEGAMRVVLVGASGSTLGVLENAVVGPVSYRLNEWETWSFVLPITDPKAHLILDSNIREAQIWKGDMLLSWGPMVRPSVDDNHVTVQGSGARWHLSRRHVGKANRDNQLCNPSFEDGVSCWNFLKTKSYHDYAPIVDNDAFSAGVRGNIAGRSLVLNSSLVVANDWPWGEVFGYQMFTVNGGARGVTATLSGWVYVPSAFFTDWGPDRRGLLLERLPTDWATNNYWTNTDPATNTYGGARAFYTNVFEWTSPRQLDENHPFDKWIRYETSIMIPPGNTQILQARVQGVHGRTYWDDLSLTFDTAFEQFNVDQTATVAALVTHAQDPAFDKNNVNITSETPATGVERSLVALHSEHGNIWDLVTQPTKFRDGFDIGMRYTPTARILTTHYPRKGVTQRRLHLQPHRNIASFAWSFDGESASSSVIALGTGDGSDREEASAINTASFSDGLILETVFSVGPDTPVDMLQELADEQLSVVSNPEILTITTFPHDPTLPERNFIGRLWEGDTVPVTIRKNFVADDMTQTVQFEINDDYRVVELTINPDDSLSLTLNRRSVV